MTSSAKSDSERRTIGIEPTQAAPKVSKHVRRRRATNPTDDSVKAMVLPKGAPARGTLEHFAEFCRRVVYVGEGDERTTLEIEAFQRTLLQPYFDGTEETVAILPKGNGKTSLLAALCLYHLVLYEACDIVIIAASKDQASELYEFAVRMLNSSPELKTRLRHKPGYKQIVARKGGGKMRTLPASADTIDGKGPTLIIVEELHRHASPEPYQLMAMSLHKRDGQLIAVTTAGDDHDTPLGRMRIQAYRIGTVTEGEGRVFKRVEVEELPWDDDEDDDTEEAAEEQAAPRGTFCLLEWSLETVDFDGDVVILNQLDDEDLGLVAKANPISTITRRTLNREFRSPSRIQSLWRRLRCGIWAQADDAAIPQQLIRDAISANCEIPADADVVFIGCDFGWVRDTTALIPLWRLPGTESILRVDRRLKILTPPKEGRIDEEEVKTILRSYFERWRHVVFVLDPNAGGSSIAKWLRDELGAEVHEHSQDASPMSQGAGIVLEHLLHGRFEHPGDTQYTRQMTAAKRVKVSAGGEDRFRFGHHPSIPVDAPQATAMAARIAMTYKQKRAVAPILIARG